MSRFFIQISDDLPTIENIQNTKSQSVMAKSDLEYILSKYNNDSLVFVVDENTYDYFRNYYTIGYFNKCDIVLVNDSNIDELINHRIKNAYLFVNNESMFYDNFKKLYKNVDGYIEFKMLDYNYYNEEILSEQIDKICELLLDSNESMPDLVVKQLNGYKIKTKFQEFGDGDFFIGPDANIYYHPKFYYQNQTCGTLCRIDEYKEEELNFQFTIPHLICINCECFYCDRDIFSNKMKTSEFKVPCSNSCKMTTLFSNSSKKMLNTIINEQFFNDSENLDRIDFFDSETDYKKMIDNNTKTNIFKEIEFNNRKLWSQNDKKL